MSWSIEERIGEFRPFPAQVVVYKGNTDECLAYVSGEVADRLKAENDKLRELVTLNWEWAHSCCGTSCKMQADGCGYGIDRECNYEREIYDRMCELGVETDG